MNKNSCGCATFAKTSCFVDYFTSATVEKGMLEHDLKSFEQMNHLQALGSQVTQRLVIDMATRHVTFESRQPKPAHF